MSEKEVKIIEEKEYINEEGKLVKEQVVEVITKVVLKKVTVKRARKAGEKEKNDTKSIEEKERRHNYYLLNKTELNELSRKKKAERYANDPEFREKVIERSKKYKLKKKMEKEMSENNE
jgi:hypothetical protein